MMQRFFYPRAVAVVGAKPDLRSIGGQPIRHLLRQGYKGRIFPVNPKHRKVAGLPCFPDVLTIREPVDLAIVAVPAAAVPAVVRQCAAKAIPFCEVLSSGFAEAGDAGRRLQAELADIARSTGIRVCGPNVQGHMTPEIGLYSGFGATFEVSDLRKGRLALVSQSGGFGYAVVGLADESGVGFRYVSTTGNEVDLQVAEFLEFFVADPQTEILCAYIEGLTDGRRFLGVADQALRARKPLLVWKVADSDVGRQAALSHTAKLSGDRAVYRGIFREKGIIEVQDVDDLLVCSEVFSGGRLPHGRSVAIVTISGGAGIVTADRCVEAGLSVPPLGEATRRRLAALVPSYAALGNPIDVTTELFNDPELFKASLRIIVDDPAFDMVALINASLRGQVALRVAADIAEVAAGTEKPILLGWSVRSEGSEDLLATLRRARLPRFRTPGQCAHAMGALARFAEAARRRDAEAARPVIDASARKRALKRLAGAAGPTLPEFLVKGLLSEYGIPVTRERLATSEDEAARLAAELGVAVALKVQSAGIPHKTDVGGIALGIEGDAAVRAAYRSIMRASATLAVIDGVLVQEMVPAGVELILAFRDDPQFGPMVLCGLGGVLTEVLGDVAFRTAPLSFDEADRMLSELRGAALMAGVRGRPAVHRAAVVDLLCRLALLGVDLLDEFTEIELNPVVALPDAAVVVDALGVRRSTGRRP